MSQKMAVFSDDLHQYYKQNMLW